MTLSVASSSFAPNFKMKQDEYKKKKSTTRRTQKSNRTHMLRACFENGVKKKRTWDKKKEINFLFNAGKLVSNICKTIFSCYGNSFAFFSRMFRIWNRSGECNFLLHFVGQVAHLESSKRPGEGKLR